MMILRFARVATVLALALADPASAQPSPALAPGIWHSEGYGYVIRVDRRRIQTFDLTAHHCVRGPRYAAADFYSIYGEPQSATARGATLFRPPTQDVLTRLDALPAACRRPARGNDPALNYEVFSDTFREFYPFFEQRGVQWNAAHGETRDRVSRETLFATLSELVAPLNDGHVTISAGERSFDPDSVIAPGLAPDGQPWSWRTLRTSMRDFLQGAETPLDAPAVFAGNRRVMYGRSGNIGYVAILAEGGWAEGQTEERPAREHAATAADEFDQVLTELGDVSGMIVDLRVNSGGFDAVAIEIASRFTEESRLVYRKHARGTALYDVRLEPSNRRRFAGPVIVLIGPNTVSAGETAALAYAALPHAQLIGQATRGIMSDAIPKTLPNGWGFTLSIESTYTPEGELVEARGVQPDEMTNQGADSSPRALWGRDIELALQRLGPAP